MTTEKKQTLYEKYYADKESSALVMDTYAYAGLHNGKMRFEGMTFDSGTDYRTVEHLKTYKDAGFNILLTQVDGHYCGEDWETSEAKSVMDKCLEVGINKVILLDERIRKLSTSKTSIIGEGKQFANEDELDAYISECMSPYRNHPAFYGVQLVDEPYYTMFDCIGEIFASIRRVNPKAFVQCNLMGMFFSFYPSVYPPYEGNGDFNGRFRAYLTQFLDKTKCNYLMSDRYPFHAGEDTGMYPYYIYNMQLATDVCREYGVEFHQVAQSFGQRINGVYAHRLPTKEEMILQIHILLAFGVKELSYYTYWSKGNSCIEGEYRPYDYAMINWRGEPTYLYYVVKDLNAMIRKLSPVILNFEHVSDTYAAVAPFVSKPMHLKHTLMRKCKNVKKFSTNQEVAFLSEMYDKKHDNYLYVLQNITCPKFGANITTLQKSTIEFSENYKYVDVFDGNEWHTESLVNGCYTVELKNADAVYLLPY